MDVRITVETTFDNGEKRIHQLERISRPYRVTCLEGFGLRLEDGKRVIERIQRAILCDQVEEITRESRACPTCSRVRAIHDYRTCVFDTLFGRLAVKAARAAYAVLAMPRQRPSPAGLFLRWLFSFQTGPPRRYSGSLPSLSPGISFRKPHD